MVNCEWLIGFLFRKAYYKIPTVSIKNCPEFIRDNFFSCSFNRVYKVLKNNFISAKEVFTGLNETLWLLPAVTLIPVVIVSFPKK